MRRSRSRVSRPKLSFSGCDSRRKVPGNSASKSTTAAGEGKTCVAKVQTTFPLFQRNDLPFLLDPASVGDSCLLQRPGKLNLQTPIGKPSEPLQAFVLLAWPSELIAPNRRVPCSLSIGAPASHGNFVEKRCAPSAVKRLRPSKSCL